MNCPRCGQLLGRDEDDDYGYCLYHGTVYTGKKPDVSGSRQALKGQLYKKRPPTSSSSRP